METQRKLELTGEEVMRIVYPLLDVGPEKLGNTRKENRILVDALSVIEGMQGKPVESALVLMLSEAAYNILKERFERSRTPGSWRAIQESLEKKIDNAEKVEVK